MELSSHTILITGGASGIGLALGTRFLRAGSRVIACGRRVHALAAAAAAHPGLITRVSDVETAGGREALCAWATATHPEIDVLVNNAGIQRRLSLTGSANWTDVRQEIAINFEAPLHLSMLFLPHLARQPRPAILNVTSGLSFVPLTAAPVYSATKAALHSVTLSLRHQLAHTPVAVIEIIPPAVNTDLGGVGLHTFGAPLDDFADAVFARLGAGDLEIAHGFAAQSSQASRAALDAIFTRLNASTH
ncbi:MAG TPA: SDR family NAD(P)-dependent oxidoreductase [Vicinamibacterales bacterium]|nr:SDR family NAD(P)-dependent oxidoreductase [Vicinamibacterales bacterium]